MINLIILICGLVLWTILSISYYLNTSPTPVHNSTVKYLVHSPFCKIPDLNPFDEKVMKYFDSYEKEECPNLPNLTDVNKKGDFYEIRINSLGRSLYPNLNCTLSSAEWISDYKIRSTYNISFNDSIIVPQSSDFVKVSCDYLDEGIYQNVYFLAQQKPTVEARFQKYENFTKRAPSVLILAADGVGRINLHRTMPKVVNFFKENHFYDMKGYTKVWSRTFYNIIADLTGFNQNQADELCNRTSVTGLSNCSLIWRDFQDHGYATAYMEDFYIYATFNHDGSQGFNLIPVDHYGRTAIDVLGEISNTKKENANICAGNRFITEYVYSYGLEIAELYKGRPYFGLFFTNTLSHNEVRLTKQLEPVLLEALEKVKKKGILNDSIVIVLSDHGNVYNVKNSQQDQNMPMLFISLPSWFKKEHPDATESLRMNENRLSSPFDLYLTLKDVLRRSGRLQDGGDMALGCPMCQSLFKPLSNLRNCADVGVPNKYCSCKD